MKVKDCMSTEVELCNPDDAVRHVATKMRALDCGIIPLAANGHLVGVITDRDIALRIVGNGLPPDTPAHEAMSPVIYYCFEDQDLGEVVDNMADIQVRRLPVVDRDKRLRGIISLGDIARRNGPAGISALKTISERCSLHNQSEF